jgi:hypothetical protein
MDKAAVSRRQMFVGTGAALATGALATAAWPSAAYAGDGEHDASLGDGIVGTWLIDSVSAVGFPERQTLVSFITGGIAVAVDGSMQDPAPTGLGQWEHRRAHGFAATVGTFLYDNPASPPVSRIGNIKIVAEGSVSHDSITGQYRTTATDEAGNVFYEDEGTFTGSRVQIEHLA